MALTIFFLSGIDATILPKDRLLLYAIGQGATVNYGHMLFRAIRLVSTTGNLGRRIRAKPRIESHLKSLKKEWFIMNDMILGIKHGSSGFGFDSISNMIISSKDVWDDYVEGDTEATPKVEVGTTSTSSRTRVGTLNLNNQGVKKKKRVTGDELLAKSTYASAQIMAEEISKATLGIGAVITAERDKHNLVLAAMDEVPELSHVEKAIYSVKISGRNELMEAFMSSQQPYRFEWLHAMFD
ncbi:hypothetical protein Syun_007628 [Stephania yunnanensis]|uniref:Uncharacterized protein n=1 Tax=Stephania yunnanensis TaxID=152371 RepID=A0AAP0PYP5_9MAGN